MEISARIGIGAAVATAVAGSFVAGMAVAGGDQADPPRRPLAAGPGPAAPAFANADLAPAASCEELLDWYVERGVERVGPYGWDGYYGWGGDGVVAQDLANSGGGGAGAAERSAGAPLAAAPAPSRSTTGATGTNVQEAGVDEPDVVKTDGNLLVRVQDDDLVVYDVTGDPERLGSLPLPGVRQPELLLAGDRVVVTGSAADEDDRPLTRVLVVDLADPAEPEVVDDATYGTELVTARLHGDARGGTVRLVLAAPLPDLDFVEPRGWLRGEESARDHNQDVVRDSEIEDWLPTVTRDGDTEPLLGCEDVAVPADDAGLGTLVVVGLDPADPGTWTPSAVTTDSRMAYFSADRMVLATSGGWGWGTPCCVVLEDGPVDGTGRPIAPPPAAGTSRLYSFALDAGEGGLGTTYVASGEVDGSIRDRWSMDEAGGVLRVAVGPTSETGNFNSVVTLEEDGDDLVEVGRLDKLGVNEDIQSVRWFDTMAFVVTFRQVDPLYAVDLRDPERPRLLGRLKVPGFSAYLHPLGRHRLLGVGEGPQGRGWGAQAALFDVTDLTDLRRLDVVSYGTDSQAGVATDPRQLTWLPDRRTVLTVVSQGWTGRTGWVSVLTLDDGELRNRMVEVEYGTDVDLVRTVPLPDGRVLLVTGDDVSELAL